MINITAIAFTGYPVSDIARARGFYETVLGLKVSLRFEDKDKAWIEYDVGPATLAITNMSPGWKCGGGPAIALEVADFPAAVAALRAAGIFFAVEPAEGPTCSLAVVHDPDGNSVAIHHRNAA